ncbi:asparagine--tRNA ligase isoform X3 [Drosophila ananassae]|uniref:asparagine--tRNA ligase isoform X3 n=1 Tax=Drosophila ananassae TaxID=7217 RepID=UPI0013A5DA37|nr:asparagine--tRNA ligase isoform X3 [Drosophila ananassae]
MIKALNLKTSQPRSRSNSQRIAQVAKSSKPGDSLSIQGWIRNVRKLKSHTFLDINDGSTSTKFQVVVPKTPENQHLAPGSVISAEGQIQVAPNGSYELHASHVETLGNCLMDIFKKAIPSHQNKSFRRSTSESTFIFVPAWIT